MGMRGCYLRLKESLDSLPNSEKKVAEYIVSYPSETILMPVGELAAACNTSKSAVVRLCKALGYRGYKEFCVQMNADLISNPPEDTVYQDILPNDGLREIAENVTANNIKSLENTLNLLDFDELEKAVSALENAPRILFFGCGNSGLVALDAQNKFMRIHKVCEAFTDPHIQIIAAANLSSEDVAVFISYSGETRDILETMDIVRRSGAVTISITKYGKNTLSERTDIRLHTTSLETLIRAGATGSRIGQLNMVDILFSAVTSRNYVNVKKYLDQSARVYQKKRGSSAI